MEKDYNAGSFTVFFQPKYKNKNRLFKPLFEFFMIFMSELWFEAAGCFSGETKKHNSHGRALCWI
ncbi:MAG: hypothetical protein D6677_06360 [Calditrichaeota bacterium]|nr:MAG: hypothetical protein D6677_06360 [Calditrichota bacterium]